MVRRISLIYLDAAATTPVRPEVIEAMWPYLTNTFGNPSSRHSLGDQAARALHHARERVATVLGCRLNEIIFTSGGTEADNLALKGIALATPRGRRILTTPIEHEAVLASCAYLELHHKFVIDFLPVDHHGLVQAADLTAHLQQHPDTTLVSVMLANNEVGTIQPIEELCAIAHTRAIPFHTDAVQACGTLPFYAPTLGADAISLSGHKLGAPKGIGALYLRARTPVEPILHGGGQERNRRSGTENVAGAVAFATAFELTNQELTSKELPQQELTTPKITTSSRIGTPLEPQAEPTADSLSRRLPALRDRLIHGILTAVPDAILTGHPTRRLPNNASFCFPHTSGEAVLLQLEERGILCSSGSACAAGSDEPSHVLTAMGYSREVAQTAVRFTLTSNTTAAQIEETITKTCEAVDAVSRLARY